MKQVDLSGVSVDHVVAVNYPDHCPPHPFFQLLRTLNCQGPTVESLARNCPCEKELASPKLHPCPKGSPHPVTGQWIKETKGP